MKRMSIALLAVAAAAGTSNAAPITRLPDQVVDRGRFELEADVDYEHSRRDLDAGGHLKRERTESDLTVGYGLGGGLQLNAEITYLWKDRLKLPDGTFSKEGVGDLKIGALYSNGTKQSRLMNASFDVKFDTARASEGGTGNVEYVPQIGYGMHTGSLTPYASYAAHIRNHGEGDTHDIVLGTEIGTGKDLTWDTRVVAEFHDAHGDFSSRQRYRLDLRTRINTSPNCYVRPGVSLIWDSAANVIADGSVVDRVGDGFGFGASLTFNWKQ
ncbi:MAG TPA: hypothetical protein VNX25_10615 [Verrucomicrobiae bacterium]|nr:hypothetical protein [Verrucomicrobiae bacterium]